jgi:hypothetical protein
MNKFEAQLTDLIDQYLAPDPRGQVHPPFEERALEEIIAALEEKLDAMHEAQRERVKQ